MIEWLVPGLVFIAVVAIGGVISFAWTFHRDSVKNRLSHPDAVPSGDPVPGRPGFLRAVSRVGEMVSSKRSRGSLKQELAKAGYYHPRATTVYLGAKMLLFAIGVSGITSLVMAAEFKAATQTGLVLSGSLAMFLLPNMLVSLRRGKRTAKIRYHLPDALDLLEICVSSGMGMSMAWNAVTDEIRRVSPCLSDEMALTNLEMHLGAPRATALKHMSDRSGVDEIGSLVAVLVQSERFGTSVVDALCGFANTLRETRTQRAEEMAEKMAVKLLFPMVLFIFPALLVVLVGPAGIKLADMMGTY